METGKVDLVEKFGRENINVHDVFTSAPASTAFLRAYAFNENKSILQKSHSGHKNVWGCTSDLCEWEVSLTKKRPTKRANTKLAFCPTNAWFVSSVNTTHSPSCDSVGECSSELLSQLSGFKSALVKGLSTARVRVATAVKTVDNVNVDNRPALVYRAISRAKQLMTQEEGKYEKLPPFLRAFERLNPGSRVCCQLDSKGRFFRAFLSIGPLVATQDNWIPVLESDGTHMKNDQYNGVCLLLIAKDGDWSNIPVAIAFVHKETAENFEWFFSNCMAAGIKLNDRPTFTDRGKQREAQVRLRCHGHGLNLKFCALHIYFNVCDQFRTADPSIANIKGLLFRLQATTTLNDYNEVLAEIQTQFPAERTRSVKGKSETQNVAQYLRAIHPTTWTRFGNCPLSPEETSAVTTEWEKLPTYGKACALFDTRTTSAVEGQNNGLLLGGVRDCQVFEAFVLFCNVALETLVKKKKKAAKWLEDKHTVTPRAKTMFDRQVWGAAACTVRKSSNSIFLVDDLVASMEELGINVDAAPSSGHLQTITFTVDLKQGTCMRCPDRHQLMLPCRHIIAALYSQSGDRTSTFGAFRFYHPAYTVEAYVQAFMNVSIQFPFLQALMPDPNIQPPPLYNQAGKRVRSQQRDVVSREKRIPSRGESNVSSLRQTQKNPKPQPIERVATAAKIRQHFIGEIRAEEKKKRKKYTCSRCGKAEGHNAAKCPNGSNEILDTDIQPGIYIVGSCPLELLRQQREFVDVEVEEATIIDQWIV